MAMRLMQKNDARDACRRGVACDKFTLQYEKYAWLRGLRALGGDVGRKTFTDTGLALLIFGLTIIWVIAIALTPRLPDWQGALILLAIMGAVYGAAMVLDIRRQRRLDELELAAWRFGSQWGLFGGTALMVALVFLPPFQTLLVQFADRTAENGGVPPEVRMFLMGVTGTFVAQEIAKSLIIAGWKRSKR